MSTAGEIACENCGVGHGPDDIFCENCGYDFITGSLPSPDEHFPASSAPSPSPSASASASSPVSASGPVSSSPEAAAAEATLVFDIAPDRAYFDAVVSEGELDYPDPPPAAIEVELAGDELHIGRTSQSRAIHPDLDIADLTADPAVSSRHAVIRVGADGAMTVTDVGSTNGTFVGTSNGAYDGDPITAGEPVAIDPGTPIFVGAWTRLTIR